MRDPNLSDSEQQLSWALQHIGVTCYKPGISWPVYEGDYMKFMGGPDFDTIACDQFCAWLDQRGFSYERHRDRAVRHIDPRAVELIDQLWKIDDEGEPIDGDPITDPALNKISSATHVWDTTAT